MYSGRRNSLRALLDVFPEIWGDSPCRFVDASKSEAPYTKRAAIPGFQLPAIYYSGDRVLIYLHASGDVHVRCATLSRI